MKAKKSMETEYNFADDQDERISRDSENEDGLEYIGTNDSLDEDDEDDEEYSLLETDSIEGALDEIEPDLGNSSTSLIDSNIQQEVLRLLEKVVAESEKLFIHKLSWLPGRLEIILSANDDKENPEGPQAILLERVHKSLYSELELREQDWQFLENHEILVASPGVSDILKSERDFEAFKGFMVSVFCKEIYRKKTLFEGTLIERNEEEVIVSLKGRLVKIPRNVIAEVKLPKAKYEPTDFEMRKLR